MHLKFAFILRMSKQHQATYATSVMKLWLSVVAISVHL